MAEVYSDVYLKEQLRLHPSMQPQDVVKLCYQAVFGAEHLLGDIDRVKQYFDSEFEDVPERDGLLAEYIADDVCRVNLAVWKKLRLPSEWLFNLFVVSAKPGRASSEDAFWELLAQAENILLPGNDWRDFIDEYKEEGARPVHHSNDYRKNERPAYRVISGRYVRLIPIFQHLPGVSVVAIDGRAASGKTTIANDMAEITGAGTVHADDFFLPNELRTSVRLSAPGGNFHRERLVDEVLPFLRSGDAFTYRKFGCGLMDFDGERTVAASALRVVEGAYSCHPALGEYMDLRVFSDISPPEQQTRIAERNGADVALVYADKWIPMEENYLKAFRVMENAHLVV